MKKDKNKTNHFDIIKISVVFLSILCSFALILAIIYKDIRVKRSTTETVSCEVTDKYRQSYAVPRNPDSYTYYIVVSFEDAGGNEITETITLSEKKWNKIHMEDVVSCDVTYDSDGIIDIEMTK